jgi:two-component system response regulator MprA
MFPGAAARTHGHAAPRILLVDDDRDLLVPLADQLRHDGFEVTTARDGDEALRRLDSAWPDLLIIDLLMPRMDGLTLARGGEGARRPADHRPVGHRRRATTRPTCSDEFAEDYVTKPYHYSELRARIQRVLRRVGDRVPRKGLDLGPDLSLELHRRQAIVGGEEVQLTPTGIRGFSSRSPRTSDRSSRPRRCLSRGWAETGRGRAVVRLGHRCVRLRQKLEVRREPAAPPAWIVRGVGYRLDGDATGRPGLR